MEDSPGSAFLFELFPNESLLTWRFRPLLKPEDPFLKGAQNFNGAVPETLLFTGTQITFDFDGLGAKTYTASHRFSERNPENLGYGWNHVIDGDTGTWRKVYFDQGTTIPMYQTSNSFGMLFP